MNNIFTTRNLIVVVTIYSLLPWLFFVFSVSSQLLVIITFPWHRGTIRASPLSKICSIINNWYHLVQYHLLDNCQQLYLHMDPECSSPPRQFMSSFKNPWSMVLVKLVLVASLWWPLIAWLYKQQAVVMGRLDYTFSYFLYWSSFSEELV